MGPLEVVVLLVLLVPISAIVIYVVQRSRVVKPSRHGYIKPTAPPPRARAAVDPASTDRPERE
jgi:hypothetical protein